MTALGDKIADWVDCPDCTASTRDSCKTCKGHGYVLKRR